TSDELHRLRASRIVVLGGTSSVSEDVAAQLAAYASGGVTRLAGPDRWSTAAAISEATFAPQAPVAYVANGAAFPDALAGGPAAGAAGGPVLLTDRDTLPPATSDELRRLEPRSIVILGGTTAVSEVVEDQLRQHA